MKFTIDGKNVEPVSPIYPDDTIETVQAKLNVGPVYLYAKKRSRVTTRQLYSMFEGVISRKQVRALLGNIRHLNLDTYTYDDLVSMNLDPETLAAFDFPVDRDGLNGLLQTLQVSRELTSSTYTYNDMLDLSLDGTYDMYVSIGQHTPAGVPIKPNDYSGSAESRPERKRVLLEYLPLVDDRIWGVTSVSSPAYLLTPSKTFVNLDSVRPEPGKLQVGFTEFKCVMDTRYNRLIPLDYAFRLLHVNENVQLMRLNSIEPRYRVYAPTKDASGNKIPSIRSFVRGSRSDSALTCNFGTVSAIFRVDGSYEIQYLSERQTAEDLNELFKIIVNPFIELLNSTIQWGTPDAPKKAKTEIYFPPFELSDARILTSTLQILTSDVIENELHIPDGSPLLNVFATDGDGLIYKRVSNFNIYDSAQQILRKEGLDAFSNLVRLGLSETEARDAIENFADGGARRSAVHGIPVQVTKRSDGTLFTLKNVDQIGYVNEIKRYITALFQSTEPDYISEEDYISDVEQEGGGDDVNRRLANDFFALSRLKARATVTSKTSKQCLKDKMPIVLTKEEHDAILADPSNPDPFNIVETKDGTNTPLQHDGNYYVCPRYWDMAHKVPVGDKFFLGAPMSEKRFREEGNDRLIGPEEEQEGYAREGKDIYEFLKHRGNTTGRKYTLVSDRDYELDPSYGWMTAAVSKKNPVPCCYFPSHIPKDVPTKIPTRIQTAQTGLLKPGSRSAIPSAIALFLGKAPWFRVGVEDSSFLACLALFDDLTIEQVKTNLLKELDGKFQIIQNGNLATHFAPDMSNQFRKRNAETNFRDFLKFGSDIDFTFLWDLIGYKYNLVIFNGDMHDMTRIELICPTNYFSQNKFNLKKPTILMLKQGRGYEPIWQEKNERDGSGVKKKFIESHFLSKIQRLYATSCAPARKYSTAAAVNEIVHGIQLTHSGKVIGILGKCHVPCYPSAPISDEMMDVNDAPRLSASETFAYLDEISKRGIACTPTHQVEVNHKCIGIMVETQQYVACKPSKLLANVAFYGDVDGEFQPNLEYNVQSGTDPALERSSNRVIESRLYAACRTVLRIELKNRALRRRVTDILADNQPKSARLYELVKKAIYPKIEFHDDIPVDILKWTGGRLHLFKRNLVTGHPNDYVARLSDELERFLHLRSYLLDQQTIVDFVLHDVFENELLLTETQWLTYSPKAPVNQSPYYTLNTYDSIVTGSVRVGFRVDRVGQMLL